MFIIVIMAMFCVLAVAVAAADSFGTPAQQPPRYSSRRAATPAQTEAQKAAKAAQREAEQAAQKAAKAAQREAEKAAKAAQRAAEQAAQKAAREAQKAEQARARKAAQRAEEQRRAAEQAARIAEEAAREKAARQAAQAAHKPTAASQDQPAQQPQQPAEAPHKPAQAQQDQPAQQAQQPPRAADEYTITPRGSVFRIRPDGTRERLAEDDPICARVKAARAATSAARAAYYAQQQPAPAVRIAGKALAFTGTIPGMKRSEAIRAAERAGARGSAELTTAADILVIGSRPGKSKLDRAERWNLPTITAEQFIAALAG